MRQTSVKSQDALEKIVRGVGKFQSEVYPAQREIFERLAHRQEPIALFITCADSRIVTSLLTQTAPGELFVERNPGNLVPQYGDFVGGVSSGVEYAMLVLKVPLVIVCGHTDCGVMKGLLHPEHVAHLPAVKQWMEHAAGPRERLMREAPDASEDEKLLLLAQFNGQAQIENLKTHPSVRSRLDAGEVQIHGWVYDIGAGSGWSLDPDTGNFRRIGQPQTLRQT